MITDAIQKLVDRIDLNEAEARSAMEDLMSGQATDAQVAGFLTALRMKGETASELVSFARVLREKAEPFWDGEVPSVLDTCGTGGDRSGTFNISTASAFVAAGAGLRLFWVMLVPGPRTRAAALGEEGRITFAVGIGLVIALLASGLIEGFVTPSTMPWWLKIVIGAIACAAFWAYIFVAGRVATSEGVTGDVEGDFATDAAPVVG